MGERLKLDAEIESLNFLNGNGSEVATAFNGELLDYRHIPDLFGEGNSPSQVVDVTSSLTSGANVGLLPKLTKQLLNNDFTVTLGVSETELWDEFSPDQEFVDYNNILQGPDWDFEDELLSIGGSWSCDESTCRVDRLIVLTPHEVIKESASCRSVLLQNKIPLYELMSLSKNWFFGHPIILVQ
jgi:hypothetical protein